MYRHAGSIAGPGVVVVNGSGDDPVSATGQAASGANLICFTAGKGPTHGRPPTPSSKTATNNGLLRRMELDMDFNAGSIPDSEQAPANAAAILFALMIATASGHRTCSGIHGLGNNQSVPRQIGAVM
jgi:altronate hydrolase